MSQMFGQWSQGMFDESDGLGRETPWLKKRRAYRKPVQYLTAKGLGDCCECNQPAEPQQIAVEAQLPKGFYVVAVILAAILIVKN